MLEITFWIVIVPLLLIACICGCQILMCLCSTCCYVVGVNAFGEYEEVSQDNPFMKFVPKKLLDQTKDAVDKLKPNNG